LEPPDLAACLSGPHGLDLVVELAHDLRSPLTSILFLAEALQQGQGGPVTGEQARQLGLIYSAALCLCATASDVLELARGGQRLVDRAPAPFSVAEVFGSVRSMILPIAEEKRLEVRLVHPVPERRTGHERALSRVLLNLATNAVKFTDSGFVEIAAFPVGARRLEFSVRDTGNGIDAGSPYDARTETHKNAVARPRTDFANAWGHEYDSRNPTPPSREDRVGAPSPVRCDRPRAGRTPGPQHPRRHDRPDRGLPADAADRRIDQADVARTRPVHADARRSGPAGALGRRREHAAPHRLGRYAVYDVQVPHDAPSQRDDVGNVGPTR